MKKSTVVLLVLLLLPIGGFCTDMEFYVSGGGGFNAARIEDDELFRSSLMYDIDISLLNFRFGDQHTIGMPFVYKSYSETSWVGNRQLDMHRDFGLGLFYRYTFNPKFELMAKTAVYYKSYPDRRGSLFGMDLSLEFWLMPIEYIGLRIPMTMGFTKSELDFSMGLGAVVRYTKEDI